jgi:hypothetical protein
MLRRYREAWLTQPVLNLLVGSGRLKYPRNIAAATGNQTYSTHAHKVRFVGARLTI